MAKHPVCIFIWPRNTGCLLSEPDTDKSRNFLHQQDAKKSKDSPKEYSSKLTIPEARKVQRRPGLCSLPSQDLLKQTIFNRYPSVLQLRIKVPDNHPSSRLKHASRILDLRKAALFYQSYNCTPELPVVHTSLRGSQNPLTSMHNQISQLMASPDRYRLQTEEALWGNLERWKPPPRVMVSDSMLQAYSEMRGNNDKNNWRFGPLHEGLFLADRECPGGDQLVRPVVNSRDPYPTGVCFYWEPLSQQCKEFSHQVPPQGNSHSQKNGLDIPTLQNILGLAPPGSKIKHYKGEDGYGNYGHICIKNSWVDPESEEEVITALRRESTKSIPAPVIPIVSEGAKIMTLQEQDAFYKDYTREVSDLGDSEGDPRCLRIAPATFARWADGALKGDSYINTEVPSPKPLPREQRTGCPPVSRHLSKTRLEPQYDMETGSMMSGYYEPEQEPSIIFSAKGVDLDHRPRNFAFSYPGINDMINRNAFGPDEKAERIGDWIVASTVSHQDFVLGTERACNEFANDNDPTGTRQFEEARAYIDTLEGLHRDVLKKMSQLRSTNVELELELFEIHRKVWFMKKELVDRTGAPEVDLPSIPASVWSLEFGRKPNHPYILQPIMSLDRHNSAQRPGIHAVYFEEREKRELVNIKKTELESEALEAKINPITESIYQLMQMHEELKLLLGFSNRDVNRLIPASIDPERPI